MKTRIISLLAALVFTVSFTSVSFADHLGDGDTSDIVPPGGHPEGWAETFTCIIQPWKC